MGHVVDVHDARALDAAAGALEADDVVLLPTDTVYGLAALRRSAPAVDRLYELKGRPAAVPIAVLVASYEQALELVAPPSDAVRRLVEAYWPGPLTVVLAARDGGPTIGVRCPDHPFVRDLAARVGPLSTTSANRHGAPTPSAAADAAAALTGEVGLVIDGGVIAGTASTVVDGTDDALAVLREGPISPEQVRQAALV